MIEGETNGKEWTVGPNCPYICITIPATGVIVNVTLTELPALHAACEAAARWVVELGEAIGRMVAWGPRWKKPPMATRWLARVDNDCEAGYGRDVWESDRGIVTRFATNAVMTWTRAELACAGTEWNTEWARETLAMLDARAPKKPNDPGPRWPAPRGAGDFLGRVDEDCEAGVGRDVWAYGDGVTFVYGNTKSGASEGRTVFSRAKLALCEWMAARSRSCSPRRRP